MLNRNYYYNVTLGLRSNKYDNGSQVLSDQIRFIL